MLRPLPMTLVGFLLTTLLSLLKVAPSPTPSTSQALLKCLPVLCLVCFLLNEKKGNRGTRWGLLALVCSVMGDYYLIWPETHFLHGIGCFGLAQVGYILALSPSHMTWFTGAVIHGGALVSLLIVLPLMQVPQYPLLKLAVTGYGLIIHTMLWCAIDRARHNKDLPSNQRYSSVIGASVFVMSDLSIAVCQVGGLFLPRTPAQVLILSTYYAAQLFLTLGFSRQFWTLEK